MTNQADDHIDDLDCYGIPEYFCESLTKIEQVGPCRRLVFVIHQTMNGRKHRMGVVKVVLPADELAEVTQKLAADIHNPRSRASRSHDALAN